MRFLPLFLFFVPFVTAIQATAGETAGPGNVRLNDVVVTASRSEQDIADAPAAVSVVTAGEMKKRNIQSVDQALTLLPGVFDTRNKGLMATTAAVTIRGVPLQGRTLFMLDGMPLNDAYSAGVQYGGIFAGDLRQIEVVRGPSSSLYGGNAMGGVVNMISEIPDKREATLRGGYGDASDGMAGLWSIHASGGDRVGKFRIYAALGYRSAEGYPTGLDVVSSAPPAGYSGWSRTTNNTGSVRYLIGDTGDNGWYDYSAAFRIQYDISDKSNIRFSFLRSAYRYSYDSPHTYLRDTAGNPVYSYGTVSERTFLSGDGSQTQDIYTITAEAPIGDAMGKFLFGINNQGDNWYITPQTGAILSGGPGKRSDTPNTSFFTDLQVSLPVLEKHLLTGGVSFRYDYADTTERSLADWRNEDSLSSAPNYWAGGVSSTYAAYLQAEISLLDSLTAYAGVRDDYWVSSDGYAGQTGSGAFSDTYGSKSRNAVSPKGAVVWKPVEGTVLRISGGRAFHAPTIYQMFRTWASVSGTTTTTTMGNPGLKPETVLSWDAGLQQELWKGADIKATYFENYLSDLIYTVLTSTGNTAITKQQTNVGAAESKGFEVELGQKFGKPLRIFAAYTYIDSAVASNDSNPALVGKKLTQTPRHMLNLGLDATWGPANLFLSGRYVSKRYAYDDNSDVISNVYGTFDPYFVADAKLSYEISRHATVSFSLDNMFNKKYFSYYRTPGRSWFAELSLKL